MKTKYFNMLIVYNKPYIICINLGLFELIIILASIIYTINWL